MKGHFNIYWWMYSFVRSFWLNIAVEMSVLSSFLINSHIACFGTFSESSDIGGQMKQSGALFSPPRRGEL